MCEKLKKRRQTSPQKGQQKNSTVIQSEKSKITAVPTV